MLAFDCLPLVAIVNKMFFCVHGGLSPDLDRVEDVDKVKLTTLYLLTYFDFFPKNEKK